MIAEYSDKPLTPDPIGERGAEGGVRRLVSIEENHKKCHHNLQTSIEGHSVVLCARTINLLGEEPTKLNG
jgi:hypothetical protein